MDTMSLPSTSSSTNGDQRSQNVVYWDCTLKKFTHKENDRPVTRGFKNSMQRNSEGGSHESSPSPGLEALAQMLQSKKRGRPRKENNKENQIGRPILQAKTSWNHLLRGIHINQKIEIIMVLERMGVVFMPLTEGIVAKNGHGLWTTELLDQLAQARILKAQEAEMKAEGVEAENHPACATESETEVSVGDQVREESEALTATGTSHDSVTESLVRVLQTKAEACDENSNSSNSTTRGSFYEPSPSEIDLLDNYSMLFMKTENTTRSSVEQEETTESDAFLGEKQFEANSAEISFVDPPQDEAVRPPSEGVFDIRESSEPTHGTSQTQPSLPSNESEAVKEEPLDSCEQDLVNFSLLVGTGDMPHSAPQASHSQASTPVNSETSEKTDSREVKEEPLDEEQQVPESEHQVILSQNIVSCNAENQKSTDSRDVKQETVEEEQRVSQQEPRRTVSQPYIPNTTNNNGNTASRAVKEETVEEEQPVPQPATNRAVTCQHASPNTENQPTSDSRDIKQEVMEEELNVTKPTAVPTQVATTSSEVNEEVPEPTSDVKEEIDQTEEMITYSLCAGPSSQIPTTSVQNEVPMSEEKPEPKQPPPEVVFIDDEETPSPSANYEEELGFKLKKEHELEFLAGEKIIDLDMSFENPEEEQRHAVSNDEILDSGDKTHKVPETGNENDEPKPKQKESPRKRGTKRKVIIHPSTPGQPGTIQLGAVQQAKHPKLDSVRLAATDSTMRDVLTSPGVCLLSPRRSTCSFDQVKIALWIDRTLADKVVIPTIAKPFYFCQISDTWLSFRCSAVVYITTDQKKLYKKGLPKDIPFAFIIVNPDGKLEYSLPHKKENRPDDRLEDAIDLNSIFGPTDSK